MLQITPRVAPTPIEGLWDDFMNKGAGQLATVLTGVAQAFGRPSSSAPASSPALPAATGYSQAEVEQALAAQRAQMEAQMAAMQQTAAGSAQSPPNTVLGLPLPVVLIGAAGLIYYVRTRA